MGWASYFEDIQERLSDDLDNLKRYVDSSTTSHSSTSPDIAEVRRRLTRWLKSADEVMKQVQDRIDLAAKSSVDLAHRVITLEEENVQLSGNLVELNQARRTIDQLQKDNERLQQLAEEQRREIQDVKQNLATTQADLTRLTSKVERLKRQIETEKALTRSAETELTKLRHENQLIADREREIWQTFSDTIYNSYGGETDEIVHTVEDLKLKFKGSK
jgi:chromosome segregation ATPase